MDFVKISDTLTDETAVKNCSPDELSSMKTQLRKYRCEILDDLHERQKRLDRVDLAIRITEKELKERKTK